MKTTTNRYPEGIREPKKEDMRDPNNKTCRKRTTTTQSAADAPEKNVPRVYEVVVACRDEEDQRTVFERMREDGYRCRVLTL